MASCEVLIDKLDKFSLFQKLPTELQLRIWELSMPGPRVITVKVLEPQTIYDPDYALRLGPGTSIHWQDHPALNDPARMRVERERAIQRLVLTTNPKSPGLLFACKISRSVALEQYTECFGLGRGQNYRFDSSNETVLMPELPAIPPNYKEWFAGVRKLALPAYPMMVMEENEVGWFLSQFQSLKTLILLKNAPKGLPLLLECHEQPRWQTMEEILPTIEEILSTKHNSERDEVISDYKIMCVHAMRILRGKLDRFDTSSEPGAAWKAAEIKIVFLVTSSVRL